MRFALWLHTVGWLGLLVVGASESAADVPGLTASPAAFAVTPFENHVANGRALDWMTAEAPFEIAEKSQRFLGLDGTGFRILRHRSRDNC